MSKGSWLAIFTAVALLIWLLFVPWPGPWPCSHRALQELTWQIELMKTQRSSNESIVYISNQVFEWEKIADDYSMHEVWMAHKDRAVKKLKGLEIDIPKRQAVLDDCE